MTLSDHKDKGSPFKLPTTSSGNKDSLRTHSQHKTPGHKNRAITQTISSKRKREHACPSPSTKAIPRKRRKPTMKELNSRKDELGRKFENMFDWATRMGHSSSGDTEYTPEQHKRHKLELEEALVILGPKIKPEGIEDDCRNELFRVEGMNTTLRDYQVVGAAFMVRQETSRNDCRGSIIADDMGIGKTIQSIACILANPPSKRASQRGEGATLIVAPNQGLLNQWSGELTKHGNQKPNDICKYVGGGTMNAAALQRQIILLATYSQVERDFRLHNNDNNNGALFHVDFFRIILDEGDNIKNWSGSTSKACVALKARVRHVLTGTPLRNAWQECTPYFRFLRIDLKEKGDSFIAKWRKPETDSIYHRVMQILANRMLRREAGQFFLGRQVCKLAESHFEDRKVDLAEDEAAISKHMEKALIRRENEIDDELDPIAFQSRSLLRCTRLRQAVDHPFLLESCIRDSLEKQELEGLITELGKNKQSKTSKQGLGSTRSPSSSLHEPSIYEMAIDIKSHLDDTLSSRDSEGCLECFSMVQLHFLACNHILCRSCYEERVRKTSVGKKGRVKCPECRETVALVSDPKSLPQRYPIKPTNEVIKTEDGRSLSVVPCDAMGKRSPGNDYNGMQPIITHASYRWLKKCDKAGQVTPSTKTTVAMEIVKGWLDEAPGDKIVIFTEWIMTAVVLGRMLSKAKINFVYYTGDIPVKNRDKNRQDFTDNPNIQVMVASMKSGNVGLNLTTANRMIIMTPWWNFAGEFQAFGRVKRHGQKKETYLVRLFARGTIEERVYQLQKQKDEEIREALSQGHKPKPLSYEEKRWLMGDRDAFGKPEKCPFIKTEDEDTDNEDSDNEDSESED
ncbi:P-loop containing nucleoside triphosphate hydrolase protein [Hypoxylon argillaceum]|nr:P-loop containing nucleoside triphosphate hydrolase protein [Hypoxylon argillaceum]